MQVKINKIKSLSVTERLKCHRTINHEYMNKTMPWEYLNSKEIYVGHLKL